MVACRILNKFAAEPAPAPWIEALTPVQDILSACLADADSNVRFIAMGEASRFWVWMPGRSLIPGRGRRPWAMERRRCTRPSSAAWPAPTSAPASARSPAWATCRSTRSPPLPLPYLEDNDSVDVRRQTLVSFAQRPSLLTEDMLLKRLHDSDSSIRETASIVLKARGLNQELISLGGLIVSPKPQQRASVITLIKNRTDIDPVVWLLQLSHDADETVRIQAAKALAAQKSQTVSVKRRLAEMARSDASEAGPPDRQQVRPHRRGDHRRRCPPCPARRS